MMQATVTTVIAAATLLAAAVAAQTIGFCRPGCSPPDFPFVADKDIAPSLTYVSGHRTFALFLVISPLVDSLPLSCLNLAYFMARNQFPVSDTIQSCDVVESIFKQQCCAADEMDGFDECAVCAKGVAFDQA
jgi:hypothetical protein